MSVNDVSLSDYELDQLSRRLVEESGLSSVEAERTVRNLDLSIPDIQRAVRSWLAAGEWPAEPRFWDYTPQSVHQKLLERGEATPLFVLEVLRLLCTFPPAGRLLLEGRRKSRAGTDGQDLSAS